MNFWLVVYRTAWVMLLAVVILGVVSLFLPKIRQNEERQRRAAELEAHNRVREDQLKQLRSQQERFQSDPGYVERIAREELGKAKPGETVFRFTDRKTNEFKPRP